MKRKLLLNTATSLLMQLTTVVCGFILPRLILEYYGSEVNGLTQSITQFLSIISFLELGVGQVIQSSLYRPLAQGNMEQVSKILKSGTTYFRNIAYALMGYIVILIAAFPYMTDGQYDWQYTAVLIIAISAGSFAQYYFGLVDKVLLSADQCAYIQFSAQIVCTVFNTVASVLMIQRGCSIQTVKIVAAVIFLLNPLAVRWYINRNYRIDRNVVIQEEPVKQKWNGIAQHVSAVVLEGTDNIVLTLFATLHDVSIYSVYAMVISGVRQLYTAATSGLQSLVGTMWANNEINKLEKTFESIEIVLHFAVVFLFNCIAVLIVPFISVYTDGLTDAEYIQPAFAVILTLAYAMRCLRTPYNIMILAAGHYKQTQKCHIVAAVLNLVISVLAVSKWGLVGVAIGSLIAFAYQTLWMMAYNSKNLLQWPLRKIIKQLLVDMLATAAIWMATRWIEIGTVTYMGWFMMAIPVALIAFVLTVVIAVLFFRPQLIALYHMVR